MPGRVVQRRQTGSSDPAAVDWPAMTLHKRLRSLPFSLLLAAAAAVAQGTGTQTHPAAEIRALLTQQARDWNRGDLEAFATGYKDAPDILFMGKRVSHGYAGMLEGYRKAYPTPEKMGMLTFSDLEVQPLDASFATATGHFHLQRSAAGGGNADGFFLLVLEKTGQGWKIVRDDTTAADPAPKH